MNREELAMFQEWLGDRVEPTPDQAEWEVLRWTQSEPGTPKPMIYRDKYDRLTVNKAGMNDLAEFYMRLDEYPTGEPPNPDWPQGPMDHWPVLILLAGGLISAGIMYGIVKLAQAYFPG